VFLLHFLDINQDCARTKAQKKKKKWLLVCFFLVKSLLLSKKRLTFADRKQKRLTKHEDSDKSEVGILSFLVCQEEKT
jgi:hypothetical protein